MTLTSAISVRILVLTNNSLRGKGQDKLRGTSQGWVIGMLEGTAEVTPWEDESIWKCNT